MSNNIFGKKFSKAIRQAVNNTASELSFEIETAYEHAIDRFYNDYPDEDLVSYDRTYSTYEASNRYNDKSYGYAIKRNTKTNELFYFAGIEVNSNFIKGEPYDYPTDYVFERTYNEGIHGLTPEEVQSFRPGSSWSKDPMKPSPRELMREDFAKIANDKHIDKILRIELGKSLNNLYK